MLKFNLKTMQAVKTSIIMLVFLTIITGVFYPLLITIVAQSLFADKANGSMLYKDKTIVGSELIGQNFSSAKYFWSRPSATTPYAYNATNSSGSNLGPGNPKLLEIVNERIALLIKQNPHANIKIPVELVTASASGLDPEISVRAAMYQKNRIAVARNVNHRQIHELILAHSKNLYWGIFAETRVNVLELNLALDQLSKDAA